MPYYDSWADDRDERIQYGAGWDRMDFPGAWDNSAYSTRVNGATARFRFFGRRVAVILAIPVGDGQPVTGTFRVDGGAVNSRSVATTWTASWNQAVFDSGPLTWGEHSIEIINTGTAMSFRLDRIDFDTTGGPSTSTTSTTSQAQTATTDNSPAPTDNTSRTTTSDSSLTTTRSDSTNTALVVQTQTQSLNGTSATHTGTSAASSPTTGDRDANSNTTSTLGERKGPPITAIVSSALAVVLIIILLLGFRFWMKSRRARRRAKTIATPLSPSSFTQVPWGGFSDRTSYTPSTRPLRHPGSSSGPRSDYSAPDSDTSSSLLSPLRNGASSAKERQLMVVGEESPGENRTGAGASGSNSHTQPEYYDMPPPAYPGLGPPPTPGAGPSAPSS